MKRSLKIYFVAWGVLFALILLTYLSNGIGDGLKHKFDKLSEDPTYLETLIDLDLPDIKSVESDDFSGSQFSTYTRYFHFTEPISEDCVRKLKEYCRVDDRHWSKSSDHYYYGYGRGSYLLYCSIHKDHAEVELSSNDDFPNIFLLGLLLSFLGFVILLIWGICISLAKLKADGVIERNGPAKGGEWIVSTSKSSNGS